MWAEPNPLDLIPEINFVPKSMDEILNKMISDYEMEYMRQSGESKSVVPSSPERIFLYTEASRIYAAYQMIDLAAKMNLLKYSEGDYLDNLAALYGLKRLPAQKSVTKLEFRVSAAQPSAIAIRHGTRVSSGSKVFFETKEDIIIPAGQLSGRVEAVSVMAGRDTSGILPGQVHILVDPIPFISEVLNTEPTQGGTDVEDDVSLRLRIYYYTRSLSVAGPDMAYKYFVASYSQAIQGISVSSPMPGDVDIRITLAGGELPTESFIAGLMEDLEDKRPLTDKLAISAPEIAEFEIVCKYFIGKINAGRKAEIMSAVEESIRDYSAWQCAQIGRDLVPDTLIQYALSAGAKRLEISKPAYTVIPGNTIPRCKAVRIQFGGVEND